MLATGPCTSATPCAGDTVAACPGFDVTKPVDALQHMIAARAAAQHYLPGNGMMFGVRFGLRVARPRLPFCTLSMPFDW